MEETTLAEFSQRKGVFWIGVGLLLSGAVVPESVVVGGRPLPAILVGLGTLVVSVRFFVGVFRLLRTSATAGRIGYEDGWDGD